MDTRRRFLYKEKKKEDVNTGYYIVDLNGQWRESVNISNPDSSLYEGVYESFSNYNINSSCATMTIKIVNIETFTIYIRSYAEAYYDYVMVSQLDKTIDQNTSYLYNELVKAHTRTTQTSQTGIYNYTPVVFENIGGGEHTICIIYRKDSSGYSGDDRGYVLIDKNFTSIDTPGGDDDEEMDINNYFTIEAVENGMQAMLNANTLEYCIDGDNNWVSLSAGSYTPTINAGQKISFRGKDLYSTSSNGLGMFTVTKPFNLLGNSLSLIYGDNASSNFSLVGYDYAFYRMFYGNTNLRSVSKNFLPALALSSNCYSNMFRDCINLTSAPDLPATTITGYAYYCMFYNCGNLIDPPTIAATTLGYQCCYYMFCNCTSLTSAPDLLATTLTSYCYYYMFKGCSNLNYIKMLATNISASGCLSYWVQGVASTGTFVKHIDATWTNTGVSGVPNGWSVQYFNPNDTPSNNVNTFTVNEIFNPLIDVPTKIYNFEEGMTFIDFCNSEYNIDNWYVETSDNTVIHQYGLPLIGEGGNSVNANANINALGYYSWTQ